MATRPMIEGHIAIEPPEGVPIWDIDPYDEAILADPEDYYAELRRLGPLVYIPRYAILASGRFLPTREIFADWQRFVSSRGVGLTDFSLETPWRPPSVVLEVDPPYHTRTRTAIARALSPRAIAEWQATLDTAAEALVEEVLARGEIEAVTEFAEIYPCSVFPQAVGLSEIDARKLVDYGAMVFNALGPDNALRRAAMARGPEIVPWITARCARAELSPGGFGMGIYASADSGEITEEEAGMLVRSLLSAGVDTTVTGIGSALWCLATHPQEYARLHAAPDLARSAFEEALRRTSPVHSFCRTAPEEAEVAGVRIPADAKILCVLGAANLDEEHWPDAHRYDITRRAAGHLALGTGIHGCVGQHVARAEGEAVLRALARRVTRIELAGDPVWRPGNAIRALERLPLRLVPA